jgi:hypothetical protein
MSPERRAYTLHALTEHLERGNESSKLHHLLREYECAEESVVPRRRGGRGIKKLFVRQRPQTRLRCVNSWFSLQEHEGDPATFIGDAARGWRMAEADSAGEIGRGDRGRNIAFEARYALILSSINDLGVGIPPVLLKRLVEAGVWNLMQGLTYARQVPALNRRALSLAAVSGQARGIVKHEILEQALTYVTSIGNSRKRAESLTSLAPHLCTPLLQQTLEAVHAITYAPDRARALSGIIPHLPEPLKNEALREALSTVQEITDDDAQVEVLNALAPWLPAPDREAVMRRVLAKIHASQYEFSKVELIRSAAPHLPEPLLPEALDAAREISMDIDRNNALVALTPRLAELGRQPEALRIVREGVRRGGDNATAKALITMAPHLDEEHLRQALQVAGKLYVAEDRAAAVVGLSPYLPAKLLRRALTIVESMKHAMHQVEPLAALARKLPDGKIKERLESVMTAAMLEYDSQAARSEALARLAPHLPEGLLRLALSESRRIDDEKRQVKAMAAMAAALPPEQKAQATRSLHLKAQVIDTDRDRFEAMAYVTPLIAETVGVDEALDMALSIEHPDHCAWALTGALPHLSEGKRDEVLMGALARWRKTRRQEMLPEAFNHLAQYFSEALWEAAVKFAQENEFASYRGGMLSSLIRNAADIERLRTVMPLALNIPDERARATALIKAARQLARLGHPEEALGLARTTADELRRVDAFEGVIPYLPLPLLVEVAASVEELTYDGRRWSVLADLAPRFAALGEWGAAVQMLNSIRAPNKHALAAALIVGYAPAHDRERLAEHALTLSKQAQGEFEEGEDWWLGKGLAGLAPYASNSQLEAVLELALHIADPVAREVALSAISTQLTRLRPPDAYRLWSKTLHRSAEVSRADLLTNLIALMPVITYLGGEETVSEISQAIHDIGEWWPA